MATTKKAPVVWDGTTGSIDPALFDTWDDAAEEAAIAQAAEAADVKHIIIEGRIFAGRFPSGVIVKAPLDFSVADLDEITAAFNNPVDQVKALLTKIGDEEGAEALENQNLASMIIYAEKFFDTFQKIAQVALGKYTA